MFMMHLFVMVKITISIENTSLHGGKEGGRSFPLDAGQNSLKYRNESKHITKPLLVCVPLLRNRSSPMGGLTKHSNSYHQWFGDSLANAGGPHSPVGHIFRFTTDFFPMIP